jgi:ATP-dependent DNA helicase RecQ
MLLDEMKVITYDKMRDKPQLAFITHRYDAAKLPVNRQRLDERRKIQKEKLEAMLNYVENEHFCRTGIILEYFGEHNFQDCGHCDRCLEKKRKVSTSDHERVREMVHYQLRKGPKLPEELTSIFDDHEIPLVEDIIREMTDRDDLGYDQLGRLVFIKK